ncbi:unnamed protein product [Bursaphelenchus okinawaensis]|uniref:FERM domain-containing protein n=1 Tax=Bursaphelenchus okinawaensis TaxID=465554 RepID=A0A811JSR0_9BILA|nr:unnamed protein product [Bursaphelenchus okinawaensis]CAG9080788.1 unnamed protein product [Bursaphelenchus okinawaensis]
MTPVPSEATATMSLPQDENTSLVQQGVKSKELHSGTVTLLDGRRLTFQVSKNADGEVLFNLITDAVGLIEKDYFSLAFYDNTPVRKWLYKNKKIQKQVKDLPWDFSLEVKFYTPDPSQLADDFTRHLLTLQLRADIYNGRLPASLVNQAHLGSLIAQAELGDYSPDMDYKDALTKLNIVPQLSEELEAKTIQLYKDQKGKTPPEAEMGFLMTCRELTLYGMVMFSARHNGKPVRIGINSAGISVFQEHLRQNYIVWQGMHQLEYQRKTFTLKLKHGEKEGKSSLTFKLDAEPLAKLCWRTSVEHHTFFRLMQPEDKPNKSGFFQLGSGRFRPEGRTHFQTKMASQMFDGTPTAGPQISSAQVVSRSSENLPSTHQGSSPLHFADDKEGNSPQKRYTLISSQFDETTSPQVSTMERSGTEVGTASDSGIENAKSLDSPLFVSTTTEITAKTTMITRSGRYTVTETPSPRFLRPQENVPHPEQPETWPDENVRAGRPVVSTPTFLSAKWFSRQRRIPPLGSRTSHDPARRNSPPTPTRTSISVPPKFGLHSEKRELHTESARYTTKTPARSLSAIPYAQLIATSPSGDQLLPIVREVNESVLTTLMSLPSRSHTVLAEYISSPDNSQLSTELISNYRALLAASGHTPEQVEYRVREASTSRVYCRRSHLSPKTPYSKLPANAEEAIRTRTPSPNVNFDDSINHCIRIVGIDNTVPLYRYNISAAEAQRAIRRSAKSPDNRKEYQSLTREDNITETPKSRFAFAKKKRHVPRRKLFERDEFTPILHQNLENEMQTVPIRYYSNIYHSGIYSEHHKIVERKQHSGEESEGDASNTDYSFDGQQYIDSERLEKSQDLEPVNLRQCVKKINYPKQKYRGPSRFPKPVAVLHLQRIRRPSHGHKNGFAQVDLSPIPRAEVQPLPEYPVNNVPYTGHLDTLYPNKLFTSPLRENVDVYHSGLSEPSRNRRFKFFTWARHEGEEEVGDQDPAGYKFDHTPYEGPLDETSKFNEIQTEPLASHVTKYHGGESVVKGDEEEVHEEPHDKQTAIIHLRTKEEELQVEELKQAKAPKQPKEKKPKKEKKDKDQESSFFGIFKHKDRKPQEEGHVSTPSTSSYPLVGERYEGPLEKVGRENELDSQPLRTDVNVYHSGLSEPSRNRRFKFFTWARHEGEEEVGDQDPAGYKFDHTPYEGPLDETSKFNEIQTEPLASHVTKYHGGESVVKGDEEEVHEEPHDKQTAIIHLRTKEEEPQVEELKQAKAPKQPKEKKPKKEKERQRSRPQEEGHVSTPSTSSYPLVGERYEGPLEEVGKENELDSQPLRTDVNVYHSGLSEPSRNRRFKFFTWARHEGEEEVGDQDPAGYKFDHTPYEGPLDETSKFNEIQTEPLASHVTKYHGGESVVKGDEEEVHEEPHDKQTAIIHLRTKEEEPQVEELKQAKAPKQPKEKKPKKEKKDKDQESSFFGIFKHKDRKPQEEGHVSTPSTSSYPLVGERYEGPQKVGRENELDSQPLRTDVNVYHSGLSEPSRNRRFKFFTWARHEGEEEVGDQDPAGYKFDHTPYEGPLDETSKFNEIQTEPLASHVTKYHGGESVVKGDEEEVHEEPHDKQTAIIHLRTKEEEPQVEELKQAKAPKQPKEKKPKKEKKDKDQESSFFGIFKHKDRKPQEEGHVSTPSTSSYPLVGERYEGPLEEVGKENELDSQPLRTDVNVYHSGLSEPSRNRRFKFFTWARHEGEEEVGDQDPAGYKFDHTPYEGPLDETSKFNEIQTEPLASHVTKYHGGESVVKGDEEEVHEEPHDKQTAIIHLRTKEEEPQVEELKQAKAPKQPKEKKPKKEKKDKDQESSFFGIFKHKDRKPQEEGHASTPSTSSYPLVGERYEGPLEEVGKENELDSQPLRTDVNVYHSGLSEPSRNRRFKFFTWARHEGEEEVGDQDPAGYKFDHTPYEGPLDETSKFNEIQTEPLASHVTKYHGGESVVKGDEEEVHEEPHDKQTAIIHLRTKEEEPQVEELKQAKAPKQPKEKKPKKEKKDKDQESSFFGIFKHKDRKPQEEGHVSTPSTSSYPLVGERYEGPLEKVGRENELDSQPLRTDVNVYHSGLSEPSRNRRFKFFTWARHEGEEEVGDQDPAGYKFDHTPYEGPLDETSKFNEIQTEPLASHVTKYHGGESVVKGDEEEVHEEPHDKQTAIIHLRTKEEEPQVEELKQAKAPKQPKEKKPKKEKKDKDQESSFFGIFKHKDRKPQEEGHASTPSTSSYPLVGERYEGPLEEVGKENELDSQPLRTDVNVYHSGLSEPSRNRRFKFFTWARHEGEEEVGDQDPAGYKFDHTPYEGPLDETSKFNEIQTEPLASHVTKYHGGESVVKGDEEEVHEEPHDKQTAIIHLRTKEEEPQVEELKQAKAPKQPKEKKPKKEKKDKDQESSFFGIFKHKDRKPQEEGHASTPSTSSYPLVGERYEGPLEEVGKENELDSQPLRTDVNVYHSGLSEPSRNRRFKFFTWARHEGEEEVGDQDPAGYKFDHTPYEGPLDETSKFNEIQTEPLASHVTKYHGGESVVKGDEEEVHEEPHDKQTAIIHLRTKEEEPQVEELKQAKAPKQPKEKKPKKEKKDKDQESSFFGIFKHKDRKPQEEGHASTPSTSSYPLVGERYEGPLEEVGKENELDSQPLRTDVNVYHSGLSEPSRNRRFKFFTWARHEGEEEVGDQDPAGYKFDHTPYEGPLDETSKFNEIQTEPLASHVTKYHGGESVVKGDEEEVHEEPHDKQTAIIHLRTKEEEPQVEELKQAKAPKQPKEKKPKKEKKDKDQESSFFGIFKHKDRKPQEEGHASTPSTSSYPLVGERYEGPLEEVGKENELDSQPLRTDVNVYHSGLSEPSRNRRFKFFTWARHEGEEEVGDQDPAGYKFDHTPYEGPLDETSKFNEIQTEPLASHVTKYHGGESVVKGDEEEVHEEPHDKQTAIIHLRTKEEEPQVEELKQAKAPKQPKEKKPKKEKKDKDQESSFFGIFKHKDRKPQEEGHASTPSTSSYPLVGERYEGPLEEVGKENELDSQPLRTDVNVYHSGLSEPSRNRRFKFFTWARHEGEEEVGDQDPAGYKFDHTPYEGPLDETSKFNEIQTEPLASHVTKYHGGESVVKGDEEEVHEEPHDKQTAIIHLRTKEEEPQVEELKQAKAPKQPKEKKPKKEKKDKDQESSFFGIFKHKDRKPQEEGHASTPSTSSYPLVGERYEGPLEEVGKENELDSQPLRTDVNVYHSGLSEPSRNRRFKFFTWARHEGEEEVGDQDPAGYKFDHTPYEGPLDETSKFNEIQTEPLASHVTKYHGGESVVKGDEEEVHEEPHDKQTAIIHLRTKEEEPQVEELKQAKAPKQPKEKKPKKEKKDKDQESSFFGIFKHKDRKPQEEGHASTPSTSSYPLVGERYEGPLEEVGKENELDSQPLRTDVNVYHSGLSEPSRNRRFKFFTWARHEGEEEVGDQDPAGYKFDHTPYEGPLDETSKFNEIQTEPLASHVTKYHGGESVVKGDEEEVHEEPHDKQTAIIHLRTKEEEPQFEELKQAKAPKQPKEKKPKKEKKDKDQESSFFGIFKHKDRKPQEEGHASTPSTSSYPLVGERYEGPLEEVGKENELDSQPLRTDVNVYHSGLSEPSRNRRFKFFTWARHEGEEEVGDQDPAGYKFDHTPYEGPLDETSKFNEIQTEPLASHVTKYHGGESVVKGDEEEVHEEPHDKQTAIIHLRTKEEEPQVEELKQAKAPKQPKEKKPKKEKKDKDQESSFFGIFKHKDRKPQEEGHASTPSTSSYPLVGERYEGPLEEVGKENELDSQPLRTDVNVYHSGLSEPSRNRRFKFFTWARHEGEEEVGDQDPAGYKFDHTPYEGPLDETSKFNEIQTEPLASHVTKYHGGESVVKGDEEEVHEEPHDKQTAIIHLRTKEEEPQVEELKQAKAPKQPKETKPKKEKKDKDQESSFFGIFKHKDRKPQEEGHASTPSTSSYPLVGERYEGPLEEVGKENELDSQPLRTDVNVYHSGLSEPSRNRRFKFFTWARHEGEEEVGDQDPAGYKFDHTPYEGPLDETSKFNEIQTEPLASHVTKYHGGESVVKGDEEEVHEEPHDKQTAIIHLRTKEEEPQFEELKQAKAPKQPKEKKPKKEKKDKDQESSFFGIFKHKDRKPQEEGHASTPSTSSYPLVGERYEGPLEEVGKENELDSQPLRTDVNVYHSGLSEPSRNRRFKFFTWARHEGEEEVGDQDPAGYKFDHTPYEGPLDETSKFNEIQTEPLASHVTKYHGGESVVKGDEEEVHEEPHDKQTAIIHLRTKEEEPQVEELKQAKAPKQPKETKPKKEKKDKDQESSFFGIFKHKDRKPQEEGHASTPSTSSYPLVGERYEGPLEEVGKENELDSQPLRTDVNVYHSGLSEPSRNRRFKFFTWARHEGEEEVGDQDPAGYKFDHTPYEGPLDETSKFNEIQTEPLASHVTKYHGGESVVKGDEEEVHEEPHDKQTAIIHLRTKEEEPQVEELKQAKAPKQPKEKKPKKEKKDKDQESSFFGIFKHKDRKPQEEGHASTPSTSSYPLVGERYEGPLEEVGKENELDSQPLRTDVNVYHSGLSEPSRNRRFKFFTWARHEGEEEVGDQDPAGYKFDHTPYEGPLDETSKFNEIQTEPLASHVTKYHGGESVVKGDEEEVHEEPHDKQTAIIHLRTKEEEPQVEELKQAKAPKQPKEKKPKKEKKDKDQESSFFGIFKHKDRKPQEEGHVSTPSTSSYPLVGERYEGPLEEFFTWARHEGEEEVGDQDPAGYKFDHTPYEGPLDETSKFNEIQTEPLASHVTKYHGGESVVKGDEEEVHEEPHDKQTAIIHLRTKEEEPQVEELKQAKAPKQPKEKKPKKEKKDKDQESSFFGIFKHKDRKPQEEGHASTPSTSSYPLVGERYEGPLEEVGKENELDSQPLRTDVNVYHSGLSEPSRNRRFKFFTWARHEGEEEVGDQDPAGYKFDHTPYEGPLDETSKFNEIQTEPLASHVTKYHGGESVVKGDEEEVHEEPHDKQTAIIHLRTKEEEPQVEELKQAKAPKQPKEKKPKKEKKDKDQESSFFGIFKHKDRKPQEEGHASTPSTSSYPLVGERYEGPLEEVGKENELDSQPLRTDVNVYHSGLSEPSRNRRFKFFTWARHEGEEEVGDQDPAGYKFDHTPYEGPLDETSKFNEIQTEPLASHVTKYHGGESVVKGDEEEVHEEPHDKQTAIIHLRTKEEEPQVEELKQAKAPKQPKEKKPKKEKKDKDQESSFFGIFKHKDRKPQEEGHASTPSTSSYPLVGERYEGPLEEVGKENELDSQPLRTDVNVYHSGLSEPSRNRRFKFFTWARHEGEEEVGDQDPAGYKFDHTPYEGPLDETSKFNEIQTEPLASHVTKYHGGESVVKGDEEEVHEEPHDKQTAIIHLRTKEEEPQVEELKQAKAPKQPKEKKPKKEKKDKDQESSFFGIFKHKDRKPQEEGHVSTPSTSSYPLVGERYEGPLEEVGKENELDSQPLRTDVNVYHSGLSEPSRNRRFKFFTWARHEGEEEVGDQDPAGYKFDHTPYEGPLDETSKFNEIQTEPLASHVTKYHGGESVVKGDEEEVHEEPHDKQTAIIHLRTKEEEPQVEELKQAKAPKQPKEKKPKKEKKDKDQESSFFGIFKHKDRKPQEEGHVSTPSTSSYPLVGERYEGPLEEVGKENELDSQPLRTDVNVYHSGLSEPSRNRRFKFFTWARHEGEEEVGDQDPAGYKFDHTPYEGPLDETSKFNEIQTEPLASHVTKYHGGESVVKGDEEEVHEEPHDKQTAIIHLRTKEEEPQVEELKQAKAPKQPKEKKPKKEKKDKDQESSFFGIFKHKDRKPQEEGHASTPSTSSYPLVGERYEGPLEEVGKENELDSQPLRTDVNVYHSGLSEPSRNRRFKFFTWARHEGEEEVGDQDPAGYKFDHTPYEGPLDETSKFNEIQTEPLASHVTKYHGGESVVKGDEEEVHEEPHDKQTAIIHLRTKEEEPQVEELKQAKAPKQPKEKKPKKEKKDKDQESSFFGIFKHKDRKPQEEGHASTPSTSSYPLVGERYEGPLEEVGKENELDSQPLRTDVNVYHSGLSEPSRNRRFKFFTWARHEGEEEVGDQDPAGYKFDHTPYEGPLDETSKFNEIQTEPLASHVTKYHGGESVVKGDEEEVHEEPHDKQTAIIHLRTKEEEPQVEELKQAKAPKQPKEKKPKKEKKDKDQESSFFGIFKHKDRKPQEEGHASTPSTSSYPLVGERYEGPLEEVGKENELDSQPLRTDVNVYHSGLSEPSRNRRFKFFTWARHEGEEEVGDQDPAGYKFDHTPYEGPLDETSKFNEIQTEPLASHVTKYHGGESVVKGDEEEVHEEPHDKQTAIIHLRTKEEEPQVEELKQAKAPKQPKEKKPKKEKKDKDQESSFFGIFKHKDRKPQEEGHASTPSTSSYPLVGERYEGPLEEVGKENELDSQPLRTDVNVYHSGLSEPSRNRRFKFFTWARHEGEEEVGDQDPAGYKFDHTPYEGPLDETSKFNEIQTEPLASHVTKYHGGESVVKGDEEEVHEEPHDKQTAIIHLRTKEEEPQVEELKQAKAPKQPKEKKPKKEKKDKDQESSFFGIFKHKDRKPQEEGHVSTPSTSSYPLVGERYEGPLEEVGKENELDSQPLRTDVNVYHSGLSEPSRNRRFKFFTWARHEGEEEVGDQDPAGYKFDHTPYEGPLDETSKFNEIQTEPLASHVTKYHGGESVVKGDEEEVHEEPHDKQTAIIHLRTKEEEPQVEELKQAKAPKQPKEKKPKKEKKDKDQESSFFGIFKHKDRKPQEEGHASTPSTSSYPLVGERYEGPLEEVGRENELDSQPLRTDVNVYHSGLSEPSRNRRFKFFTWARHEGEEEVGDQDPAGYKFDHTPYEGPLDETSKFNEIQTEPLASHVTKYHGGESVVKGDEEEVHEEPYDKQTAIIHLRTKEEEPQVEELKQAKAPKQPKEKKPKKDKDQESSFFGIFKHKDRKPQEEGHVSTPSTSSYPLVGERYEGPLEEVGKENELDFQPLRTDVNVYHSGLSEPSRNRRFKFFTWARHEGEEEVGDQDPAGYKFDHTPYEGPLDETSKFNEIQTEPLASYVKKYHEGYKKDDAKKGHLGVEVKITERASGSEEESGKRTAVIHLKDITNTGDEHVKKAHNKSKTARDRDYKLFGLFKGRTNTEDSQSAFKNYPSMSYDGPVDQLIPRKDMATTDINEFASLYHRGQYSPRSYRKGLAILHLRKLEERRTASDDLDGRPKETVKSVFGRKRKRQDRGWLQSIVRARRGDHSELSAGYVCNDQSIFNQGKMVNDLNVDVFLKREMQSSYEVEVLFRDTKTSRFEPLFNRRGPVFLPKSLLDETNENVELKLREIGNKRSGRGAEAGATALNGAGPLGAQDDSDEADESSLASQPVTSNGAGTKRFRHRRAEPTDQAKKRKMAANKSAKEGTRVSLFSSLRRQISQFSSKDKKSKKSSKQDSASSSDSDSEIEVEERHIAQNDKNSGESPIGQTMSLGKTNDQGSAGPYSPANDCEHGPVIRSERLEHVYRISGTGAPPRIDPNDPSLLNTLTKCVQNNEELPKVRLIARQLEIEQHEPGPNYQEASPKPSFAWPNVRELHRYFSHLKVMDSASSLRRRLSPRSVYKCESETAPPHSTLQSWHESEISPEHVVTETDEHGNVIKKTIKTSHETHTIQKQSYQTFALGDSTNETSGVNSIENALETIKSSSKSTFPTAATHAQTRVLVYGKDGEQEPTDITYEEDQVVQSKVVTTGNRTIETITYKTVKDGVVSTNVEHRVTIQGPEVDHEAELRKAIIEATGLNPRYEVQRVEVKQERLA